MYSDFSADYTEIPQADCMSGKGFLGNMTENLYADCVQSRQAGFMQRFLSSSLTTDMLVPTSRR